MTTRQYTATDYLIINIDGFLNAFKRQPAINERAYPAENIEEIQLSREERRLSAGLMRVNHAGEISAQALYTAQAAIARKDRVRTAMRESAREEIDHLVWCRRRLTELGSRPSLLGPAWYAGSFTIGMVAGFSGDKWNLGFIAETEHQVVEHLEEHLEMISPHDKRSRAILEQMKIDEAQHATRALETGGTDLPSPVSKLMGVLSKVMTRTAYWI